jgi:hypothetical protein
MDPNGITAASIHHYAEILKYFLLTCLWIFSRTLIIYLVFLHIQFAVVWIRRHKSPEGFRYIAFMKNKLMREHVWGTLIGISVGLAVVFYIIIFVLLIPLKFFPSDFLTM